MAETTIYIHNFQEDSTGYTAYANATASTSNVVSMYLPQEIISPINIIENRDEEENLSDKLKFFK